MSTAICPHCVAPVADGALFCTACGMAVSAGAEGPRILRRHDIAATSIGRAFQMESLGKIARKGVTALGVVAGFQFLAAVIFYFMAQNHRFRIPEENMAAVVLAVVGLLFVGLAFWANKAPLPAAIVGLVFFVTMVSLDAIADPRSIIRGLPVKIIVIAMLAQAISAGLQYRRLRLGLRSGPVGQPA